MCLLVNIAFLALIIDATTLILPALHVHVCVNMHFAIHMYSTMSIQ